MAVDANALVCAWLLLNPSITGLVGNRTYTPMLEETYDADRDGPAISVNRRGGKSHELIPIDYPSLQITAWAGKNKQYTAGLVYSLVSDAINRQNNIPMGSLGFIISSMEEVGPQDVTDPETKWASVVGFYRLQVRSSTPSDPTNWTPLPSPGLPQWYAVSGLKNGVNTVFTLPVVPPPNSGILVWNQAAISPSNYTLNGTQLTTIGFAPAGTDEFKFYV